MSCGSSTNLGVPEPPGDTSDWIRRLAAAPDLDPGIGIRNRDVLALHRRPSTPQGAVYRERVVYGRAGERDLTLRLYARACPGERRPAVVFFHGGGWVSGDPSMHMRHAHGLAERGYVTALVSYRLYPEARWPGPLHDAKCAVRWLRANADVLGADPDRIAVAGASAGGQLAALVALTPGEEEGDGGHAGVSSAPQAMVLWYPVVTLDGFRCGPEQRTALEDFFQGPLDALPMGTAPLRMVSDRPPPALLLSGDRDEVTPLHRTEAFREALIAAGGHTECVVYRGRGHAFYLSPGDWQASFDASVDFLGRILDPAGADVASSLTHGERPRHG